MIGRICRELKKNILDNCDEAKVDVYIARYNVENIYKVKRTRKVLFVGSFYA